MNRRTRLLAAITLACSLCTAHASNRSLEDVFWACDYLATTRGTAAAPSECGAAYEEFKKTKFGGNFEELVAWWQVNKADAHARIAELLPAAPAPVASTPGEPIPDKHSRAARVLAATRAYFAELGAALRKD
jgi:hypothetical protein